MVKSALRHQLLPPNGFTNARVNPQAQFVERFLMNGERRKWIVLKFLLWHFCIYSGNKRVFPIFFT